MSNGSALIAAHYPFKRMTPLALLAPDQRAVLELVLRQDRSYGELSELLAIPEREVRDRAESALRSLAGDPGDPGIDTGRITDWLLGQQTERASAATAERVGGHEPSRAWAGRAAERLREVGGERVPPMPDEGPSRKATAPGEGRPRKPAAPVESAAAAAALEPAAPRPRPLRDSQPRAAVRAGEPAAPRTGDPAPRVSRLGGAVLIGVVALVLFGLLVWPVNLLGLGDDDDPSPAASAAPTPTATAGSGAEAQATGNDIVLRGVNGSGAEGLMRLFKAENGGVQFAIGAQNVPNNKKNESYAV